MLKLSFIPILFLFFQGQTVFSWQAEVVDRDRDGLADAFEQELLHRFRPQLMIDREECDLRPAELVAGISDPQIANSNGTLYGQVFPVAPPGREGAYIEVHYFHLWARDCGPFGHPLDTEYVSVLLTADREAAPVSRWKALYWFAAAHEGTLCDISNAAPARAIGAEEKGAVVWVSRGKHASFLSRELCRKIGCGGDRCGEMRPLKGGSLVNLGEPRHPLNGADWIRSRRWSLLSKMESDFDDSRLANFEKLEDVSVVDSALIPRRSLVLVGHQTLRGLEIGNVAAGKALGRATGETGGALEKSLSAVGRSFQAVGRWLFGGADDEE